MEALVTGGVGFIGSYTVDRGYEVRVIDNLGPQVHGEEWGIPEYMNKEVEFISGDVQKAEDMAKAIDGIEVIVHVAAAAGVGQSMY